MKALLVACCVFLLGTACGSGVDALGLGGEPSDEGAPTPETASAVAAPIRDAFGTIRATSFDARAGITNFGTYIGSLDGGDWIRYRRVDFGAGANLWRARVSVPAEYAGQRIELRLDSLTAAPVGTLTVASTGGWTTFVEQQAAMTVVTGVHDLFLKVVGSSGAANIEVFTFGPVPSSQPRDAFSVLAADDFDGQSGITDFGSYIGSLDGGDWVRYDDVDFGAGATTWRARVSVPPEYAGQKLELHLDAWSTPAVGTLTVASTGGWTTFVEQSTAVSGVAGMHDLYIKVAGTSGAANIETFTFAAGTPPIDPPPPPPPPPGGTCSLTASGPVTATADGQVIENLSITSSGSQAILVNEKRGVIIRNVRIRHSAGVGIRLNLAPGTIIESVSVEFTAAPATGQNSSPDFINIEANRSDDLTVRNVRVIRGSSGIYLIQSARSRLSFIEGHDFRGPYPRGQLVQWNTCAGGLLEDFSVEGDLATIYSEDNVNAFASNGVTVRRGLIDGNNAPSGVGVIADYGSSNMLVEDVDALHQGNGCFAAYTGGPVSDNVRFRRVRCRDTHCVGVAGREAPRSDGLIIANFPDNTNIAVEDSRYFNHCRSDTVWLADNIAPLELTSEDFTPRAAIRAALCFE